MIGSKQYLLYAAGLLIFTLACSGCGVKGDPVSPLSPTQKNGTDSEQVGQTQSNSVEQQKMPHPQKSKVPLRKTAPQKKKEN